MQDAPKVILDYLTRHGSITRLDVENLCNMTTATANRTLKRMLEDKLIASTGKGKNTKYIRL